MDKYFFTPQSILIIKTILLRSDVVKKKFIAFLVLILVLSSFIMGCEKKEDLQKLTSRVKNKTDGRGRKNAKCHLQKTRISNKTILSLLVSANNFTSLSISAPFSIKDWNNAGWNKKLPYKVLTALTTLTTYKLCTVDYNATEKFNTKQ